MLRPGVPASMDPSRATRPEHMPGVTMMGVVVLMAFAVFLGFSLYYAQFSGTVRWMLGVAALAVLAAFAWNQIVRRTAEPVPLVTPPVMDSIHEGELESFAGAVRRASRGLPYSEVLVASRARSAFVEHARLALGIDPEGMRAVQRSPAALRRIFADDSLVDFLHLEVGDLEERYGWVRRAKERGSFPKEFRLVLDKMEAWR